MRRKLAAGGFGGWQWFKVKVSRGGFKVDPATGARALLPAFASELLRGFGVGPVTWSASMEPVEVACDRLDLGLPLLLDQVLRDLSAVRAEIALELRRIEPRARDAARKGKQGRPISCLAVFLASNSIHQGKDGQTRFTDHAGWMVRKWTTIESRL